MPKLPSPDMPQPEKPRDIPEILVVLQDELNRTVKSAAGYFTLSSVYEQIASPGPRKGRKRGLPIFSYKGSLDGVNCVTMECDLGKIPLEYLPHILSPMCNVHAGELLQGLVKIQALTNDALAMVRGALGMEQPKYTQEVTEDEETEGEEVTS
jgi:hypothetical protein